jgi:hypothetical protein
MEIQMKQIVLILCVIMASTNAMAQQAFDGFNFQLGIGGVQSQVNASGTEDRSIFPNNSINGTTRDTTFNGIVSAGYSQSFDGLFKGFNLAGNIFYISGSQSAGSVSSTVNGTTGAGSVTEKLSGSYKLKNTWGISIEPGYYFSKDLLGYLKIAYVSSKGAANLTSDASDGACLLSNTNQASNASTSVTKAINGVGYGFGGKYQISRHVYAGLDFLYVDYSAINQSFDWINTASNTSNASFKPKQYMGFLSIGYKF